MGGTCAHASLQRKLRELHEAVPLLPEQGMASFRPAAVWLGLIHVQDDDCPARLSMASRIFSFGASPRVAEDGVVTTS